MFFLQITDYLEAGRLRWQDSSSADGSNFDARHCAADVQVVVVRTGHLHHSHALRTAHVLSWILKQTHTHAARLGG